MSIFDRGAAFVRDQLLAHASSPVSIDTGDGVPLSIDAVIGVSPRANDDTEDVSLIHSDQEFSVDTSLLTSDPSREWIVTFLGKQYRVFEWDADDSYDYMTRLKTTLVA